MKPVAIFQHDMTQRPGYLLDFLERHDIPRRIICPDSGEYVPEHASDFSGLIFLGSPRSVNDPLDWIDKEMELIRQAMAADKPVLGHCFGGQLMAKTLGAQVMRNPSPQIGWGQVLVTKFDEAREWFGERRELNVFHWHYESFAIPRRAKRMLFGYYGMNKGFALGKHLGLQIHLEVTEEIIREWCRDGHNEIVSHPVTSVQSSSEILKDLDQKTQFLRGLADRVYTKWIAGLPKSFQIACPNMNAIASRRETWGSCLERSQSLR